MIDFETLGVAPHGRVVDMAVVPFDIDKISSFNELAKSGLHLKFDLRSQSERPIDPYTVEWWKGQSEEAKINLKPNPDKDLTIEEAIKKYIDFLKSVGYDKSKSHVYCRGMSFDIPIFTNMLRGYLQRDNVTSEEPFKFWNERDVRSCIEAYTMTRDMTSVPLRNGVLDGFIEHNSIHDCAKACLMLQYAKAYALGTEEPPSLEETDKNSVNKLRIT